jgi:hypothetical protein
MVSWVFFRSPDLNHSAGFLKAMFSLKEFSYVNSDIARLLKSHFVLTAAGLAIIGLSPLVKNLTNSLQKNKIFAVAFDVFLMAIFVFAAMRLSAATHNPFIYFQF